MVNFQLLEYVQRGFCGKKQIHVWLTWLSHQQNWYIGKNCIVWINGLSFLSTVGYVLCRALSLEVPRQSTLKCIFTKHSWGVKKIFYGKDFVFTVLIDHEMTHIYQKKLESLNFKGQVCAYRCTMDRTPEPMVNTDGGPTRSAGEIENKTVSSYFLPTPKSQTLVLWIRISKGNNWCRSLIDHRFWTLLHLNLLDKLKTLDFHIGIVEKPCHNDSERWKL